MANFTTAQQTEIREFFLAHAESRRENMDGVDTDYDAMLEADAEIAESLAEMTFLNAEELFEAVREACDDYEDIFASMEDYSEELAEIAEEFYA